MSLKSIRYVATVAVVLALFVVMLGAYTRLTDAGLGCPDWPGCYGHMVLPSDDNQRMSAAHQYPDSPIESRKAWTEMAHRYAAGTLGVFILLIAGIVFYSRRKGVMLPWGVPLLLIVLVLLQAALGMWTVTLKLLPIVVMSHLLGGMLIFSLLCHYLIQLRAFVGQDLGILRAWILLGLVIVFLQIALGGWVSSNYAGIACIGFPRCNGQWWPPLYLSKGFYLFSSVGANYQGGVLDHNVRVTIQLIHRLGAFLTAGYLLILAFSLIICIKSKPICSAAIFLMICVCLQIGLGVANVVYLLPLWVAVAHNGVAALLLATMFVLFYLARGDADHAFSE